MAEFVDFYARLGIPSDATASEIKIAFRKLAKVAHPDTGPLKDGGHKFRELNEAYATLSDPESKAEYYALRASPPEIHPGDTTLFDPVRCTRCKEITAQPRYVLFWRVWSIIFVSVKEPIQGIYCSKCAKDASLYASIFTGVLGWWSAHGLINTPIALFGNAFGGKKFPELEEKLLFQNTLAFVSRNDLRIAGGIASKLLNASNPTIRNAAADIVKRLISANVSISKLKDPWSFDSRGFLAGLFLLMLVPASLVASFFYEDYSKNSTARDEITAATAYTGSRPTDSSTAGGPEQVELPSCSSPPANGSRLGGILKKLRGVHTLEIENGSSGDAIVNLRDAATNKLIYSFFVQKGKHAVVKKIPDGSYKIQYAIGDGLGQDCKTLLNKSANQFPAIQDFVTRKQDMGNYTRIGYSVLSYTLYSVPGGNVRPEAVNPAEFDN